MSFVEPDFPGIGSQTIAVGTIESTDATSVQVNLGSDAGDDFIVDTDKLVVEGDTGRVGLGTVNPVTKLTVEGTITLKEQADADSDTAAYGQLWVNTATPNELYFTTDAGDDIQITTGTGMASAATAANDVDALLHHQVFS